MAISTTPSITELKAQLNSFDLPTRTLALEQLNTLSNQGHLALHVPIHAVNMHAHTFYSFNAYGHSPSSLAWLARESGYAAIGIVDFDVLDGVDEFLAACDQVGVRGSTAIETRVFVPEFNTREISSPGEPGVAYHMGIGFTSSSATGKAGAILADMRERAALRNHDLIARVNAHLDPVQIDYERDVLPLTPAGNATERHILVAYTQAALSLSQSTHLNLIDFWTTKLDAKRELIESLISDLPKLHNLIRTRLMKRGGVGYVPPGPGTFPSVDEFHEFVVGCRALPCATWLDGTSTGEQAIEEYLSLMIAKGVVALNIIPDRNWNITDAVQKQTKLRNLYDVVALAKKLDLPLNIGTEMNAYGQKLIDDFTAPELGPVRSAFIDGAFFIYGHTQMERCLGMGCQSDWANSMLPTRSAKNDFYMRVGHLLQPGKAALSLSDPQIKAKHPAEIIKHLG
jgi:hypothetical protein